MELRKRLNDIAGKVPYIGKALTAEIKPRDLAVAAIAAVYLTLGSINPAKAGPRVNTEAMWGENEDAQTMTLDTKVFGTIGGKLDYFLRNRTPIDMNERNTTRPTVTFIDLDYELLKGLDVVLAAELVTGAPADPRRKMQNFYTKNGLMLYTVATRKLGEDPNTKWKFDLGYSGKIRGDLGWRTNLEQWFIFPDGDPTATISRFRLGATYQIPGSKTILSFGPALDINNIQNGDDAATNPRTMMPGAHLSLQFK